MQIRGIALRLSLALAVSLSFTVVRAQEQPAEATLLPEQSLSTDDSRIMAIDLPLPPIRPRVSVQRTPPRPAVAAAAAPARTPAAQPALFRPVSVARSFWLTVGTGF